MIRPDKARWTKLLAGLAVTVLALTGCQSADMSGRATAPAATADPPAAARPTALFYAKSGSLYVSSPPGTPGRKLTDGPGDAQPAPAPDLSRVAFVRQSAPWGGALWVLDLGPDLTPAGPPRRLMDPDDLPRPNREIPPLISHPRWSPTGERLAFIANPTQGAIYGGALHVADSDTGALTSEQPAPFAETGFAWSPDGSHIAWLDQRSDVRPTNVNTLAVNGSSTPLATGTNASSVAYSADGRTVLFTNGDASSLNPATNPFPLRDGGIYEVAADADAPTPLFTRAGSFYNDLAVLASGTLAFTTLGGPGGTSASRTIQVLDTGSTEPRTVATQVNTALLCGDSPAGGKVCVPPPGPAWGPGDLVAYLDTAPERFLVVTDPDNRDPRRVDAGVDSFAWAPAMDAVGTGMR